MSASVRYKMKSRLIRPCYGEYVLKIIFDEDDTFFNQELLLNFRRNVIAKVDVRPRGTFTAGRDPNAFSERSWNVI